MKIIKTFKRNGYSLMIWEGPGKANMVKGDKRYFISTNGTWMLTNEEIGLFMRYCIMNNVRDYKAKKDIEDFRKVLEDIEKERGLKDDKD